MKGMQSKYRQIPKLTSTLYTGLMSVYSREEPELFEKALESILMQTCRPTYFVLVKDGALGKELNEIIKNQRRRFQTFNIEFIEITNRENYGLGRSLNIGLKECPTELVARFDSDDINFAERMEKTISYYSSTPDLAVLGTQIYEFDNKRNDPPVIKSVPRSLNCIRNKARKRNPFNHMSVTFRKSVIESVGGYQNVSLFEDYYLWVRVIQNKYRVGNLNDVLVCAHVDKYFVYKRGGFSYFKKEAFFQYLLLKLNFINKPQFLFNILTRGGSRLIPKRFLRLIYRKLRKCSYVNGG